MTNTPTEKAGKYYKKLIEYKELIEYKADKLGETVNQMGQEVHFYEHPLHGDEYPVIVIFPEYEVAFNSDFFDIDDMIAEHGEYTPYFVGGELTLGFQLPNIMK